uniref:AlNc14C92G5735 protein n=1 Tax=Albugo laibachii Nc14 TaxID=890382 RepID=F0WGK7_9STRA|nr:AlNc14C92G5735 [Albugo laibachii Nc14]|eukprot:CCA20371.1 AlNc14C92G5735 [Albugo laibachii Nc14]
MFGVAAILFFTALSGILISDSMLHDDEITSEDPLQEIINAPYASLNTKSLYDGETWYFRKEVEAGDPFDGRDTD